MNNSKPPDASPARRLPDWLLTADDLGQTCVLLLQAKSTDSSSSEGRSAKPRLPSKPFEIGASVQAVIGMENMKKVKATKEAQGARYILRTESLSVRNALMKLDKLIDGTPVEVIPHPTLNVICGIIYDPDTINETEDYLKQMLQHQGVVNVRRIRKRIGEESKNLPLLVLSFYGTKLPEYIFFGLMRLTVRAYYPSPLLCFRCGTYGTRKRYVILPNFKEFVSNALISMMLMIIHHVRRLHTVNNVKAPMR